MTCTLPADVTAICKHGRLHLACQCQRYIWWRPGGVALEPCLAPYLLADGLEHWILWHHPRRTPGDSELNRETEARTALTLLGLDGTAGLGRDGLVCFQNVPPLRSLPTIAHSHVFVRVERLPQASRRVIQEMRRMWRRRSPWLASRQRG